MTVTSHIGNVFGLLVVSATILSGGATAWGQSRRADPRTRGGRYSSDMDPGFGREAERTRLNAAIDSERRESQERDRRLAGLRAMKEQLANERQSILSELQKVNREQDEEGLDRVVRRHRSWR